MCAVIPDARGDFPLENMAPLSRRVIVESKASSVSTTALHESNSNSESSESDSVKVGVSEFFLTEGKDLPRNGFSVHSVPVMPVLCVLSMFFDM
jgi:hypothetical protein